MQNILIIENEISDVEYISALQNAINNLDFKILKLLRETDFTIHLYKTPQDFPLVANTQYVENLKTYPTRGRCSVGEGIRQISIFKNNTKIEHLEAILYHEIGHFLDFYRCIANNCVNENLFSSSCAAFKSAYRIDLTLNWLKIRKDKRFRLVHFIQNSTPAKINPIAILETYAELFRHINGKINDEETVELYFHNSRNVLIEILNREFNLSY